MDLNLVLGTSTDERLREGCRILAENKRQFRIGGERAKLCVDKLDIFKLAVSDGTHPRLLTEVAEAISEGLAIIFENPQRVGGEVLVVWRCTGCWISF